MSNKNPPIAPSAGPRDIRALRDHLFDQLERLKADPSEAEFKRARATSEVAGRIIESANVEVDFIKHTKATGSGFIPKLPPGMTQGVVHTLGE